LTVAVYAGSFDPITNGHIDIAKRAAAIFEKVIIGIYDRPQKNLLFTAKERTDLVKKSLSHISNITVEPYSGLTVDFCKKVGARVMVRGLRASADFEYEFEIAMMNRKLSPDLELVCFMANLQYQFLSSSILKEVTQLGGNVESLVPAHVLKALREKLGTVA
jgi:pantetheine-phosphate adenylyltransferase